MKRKIYWLFSYLALLFIIIPVTTLYSFNYKLYDPDRSVNEKFIPTIRNIEDINYLKNIINHLSSEIKKDPKNFDLYRIKLDYIYLLWEISPKNKIIELLKIGNITAKQMCSYYPNHPHCPFAKALMLSLVGLERGPLNILQEVPKVFRLYKESAKRDSKWFYSFSIKNIGRLYFKLPPFPVSSGNIDLSKRYLSIAYKNNPDHPDIYIFLADLMYLTGKKEKAISYINKLYSLKPKTWLEKIILIWTKRTIPVILHKYKTDTYDKYKWDYLLDPTRHPNKYKTKK